MKAGASNPPGTTGSPRRIDLTLHVIDAPFDHGCLPVILR